jgi:IBR (half RING finger) domain-containing protein
MKKFILSVVVLSAITPAAPLRANDQALETLVDVSTIIALSAAAYYGGPKLVEYIRAQLNPAAVVQNSKLVKNAQTAQSADAATAAWILANTKPCPRCKVRIEKNGGCDYIKCYICGNEFCWKCSHYHNHGNHVCRK